MVKPRNNKKVKNVVVAEFPVHHAEQAAKKTQQQARSFLEDTFCNSTEWLAQFDNMKGMADKYSKDMYQHQEFATKIMQRFQSNISAFQEHSWDACAGYFNKLLTTKTFDELMDINQSSAESMYKLYHQFQLTNGQIFMDICNNFVAPYKHH